MARIRLEMVSRVCHPDLSTVLSAVLSAVALAKAEALA
jgi:hypothetical protein